MSGLALFVGGQIRVDAGGVEEVTLEEFLGGGGFGIVWKVMDGATGKHYALKVLQNLNPVDMERARREAELKIASKFVIPVIGFRQCNSTTALILFEYFKGTDLGELLARNEFGDSDKAAIFAQVLDALAAAHRANIVHRDLKPENILVGKNGEAKLIDFGASKWQGANLTIDGTTIGTLQYMAPDLFQNGSKTADARSDIFALGIILFEISTGSRFWDHMGWHELSDFARFLGQKPRPESVIQESFACPISPRGSEIARQSTAIDPERRYASVSEIQNALGLRGYVAPDVSDIQLKFPKLIVETGSNANAQTVLALADHESRLLGREDIAGSDVSISRRQRNGHVEFRKIGNRYEVRDAGSTKGTMLHGNLLPPDGPFTEIRHCDRLKIGDVYLRFEFAYADERPEAHWDSMMVAGH